VNASVDVDVDIHVDGTVDDTDTLDVSVGRREAITAPITLVAGAQHGCEVERTAAEVNVHGMGIVHVAVNVHVCVHVYVDVYLVASTE
jgi:hypothetical protein